MEEIKDTKRRRRKRKRRRRRRRRKREVAKQGNVENASWQVRVIMLVALRCVKNGIVVVVVSVVVVVDSR